MLVFENIAEFKNYVGQDLGISEWTIITQDMVNDFAKATGDHQWIHTNIEMASKYSPFKTTIAHGFLTLSLAPQFMYSLYQIKTAKMGLNYGTNKVRFLNPVPTASRVRMKAKLTEVEDYAPNGLKIIVEGTFEIEGSAKPACVAELISLVFE